jgi:16S rRNA (uracil1498-N3)-methyltransferase
VHLHRFYTKSLISIGGTKVQTNNSDIIHQLSHVFRYKSGQRVIFFDGSGFDYVYEISDISKTKAEFSMVAKIKNTVGIKSIVLAFSLIKKQNNELIIQKCTELGVAGFQPLLSERTEKKNFDIERAKKIAIEATEQSGRDTAPIINETVTLNDFLNRTTENVIAFHTSGLPFVPGPYDSKKLTTIVIGPEGGWGDNELTLFKKHNIPLYTLGNLTLRAETAAIAAVALH